RNDHSFQIRLIVEDIGEGGVFRQLFNRANRNLFVFDLILLRLLKGLTNGFIEKSVDLLRESEANDERYCDCECGIGKPASQFVEMIQKRHLDFRHCFAAHYRYASLDLFKLSERDDFPQS